MENRIVLTKDEIKPLVDSHLYPELIREEYEVKVCNAIELLTYNRLDLAFKLVYLNMRNHHASYAEELYKDHIRAFTLGTFQEYGNEEKSSFEHYLLDFKDISKNIENHGFDSTQTIIPVSRDGSILNGAHRLACAIFHNKRVRCIELETPSPQYNYECFYKRGISNTNLEVAVNQFIQTASNVYLAFIWPIATGKDKEIESIFNKIIYKKEVLLNLDGAHNLLSQIYAGEEWLGSIENNFRGVDVKRNKCFTNSKHLRVIAFQSDSLLDTLQMKEQIRALFNIGKHSIHITDTKEEALKMSQIIFNENSIHFLNFAKPYKFPSAHKQIHVYKEFLIQNSICPVLCLVDSSLVLALYGIRKANDIDYLTLDYKKPTKLVGTAEPHDSELKYHKKTKEDLILDSKHYFYFEGIKFVSFKTLYKMKKSRAGKKDKNDCSIMEALIEKNRVKEIINKLKQRLYYLNLRLRRYSLFLPILLLKKIGMYDRVRSIYNGFFLH